MAETGRLIIDKSAKNTEIMMGYFLQKKVYPDKILRVGDEIGRPDISTEDLSLGIEIVQAEYAEDFASKIILKKYVKFKGNAKKSKIISRRKCVHLKHFYL